MALDPDKFAEIGRPYWEMIDLLMKESIKATAEKWSKPLTKTIDVWELPKENDKNRVVQELERRRIEQSAADAAHGVDRVGTRLAEQEEHTDMLKEVRRFTDTATTAHARRASRS